MHFQNKINIYNFCFWKEGMFAEKLVGFTLCMYNDVLGAVNWCFVSNKSFSN